MLDLSMANGSCRAYRSGKSTSIIGPRRLYGFTESL